MKKYLFIDRDGTLIDEPQPSQQVDSLDKLMLEPQVIPALLALQQAGYQLVMVSNQDGLGTQAFPQQDFDRVQNWLLQLLASQGIHFADILICPHFASDHCACRKPKTGLVERYLRTSTLDLANSYVIGDRQTDLQLAENMGINGIYYQRDTLNWPNIVQQLRQPARRVCYQRQTKETTISLELDLDQRGVIEIDTPIHFFNHMLIQVATHGGFSLSLNARGDTHIDDHHLIEDTALTLGHALKQALQDKRGLARFGFTLPMDDCLAQCALDLSGRPYLVFSGQFTHQYIGDMSSDMVGHFFHSLAYSLGANLHLSVQGSNDHHRAESLFKAFGRALRQAILRQGDDLPSSKGVLS